MRALIAALVLIYAWWAVGLASFSRSATIAVVLAGLLAAAAGLRLRRASIAPRSDGVVMWAGLAAAISIWQLAAFLQKPRDDHPTLSSLTNDLLDSHAARAAAFAAWIAAAVELGRR